MTLRVLRLGVAAMLAVAALAAAPAVAQDDCDGITVVVDFTAFDGEVEQGCAPSDASTGLEALRGAGFSYSFVPQIPGMVCQIDGVPDPCNLAPADAYWSYWLRDTDGEWTYSTEGAGTRATSPDLVEGWAFGAGDPPGTPTTRRDARPAGTPAATDPRGTPAVTLLLLGAMIVGVVLLWRRRP